MSLFMHFAEQEPAEPAKFIFRRAELVEPGTAPVSLLQVGGDLSQRALQIMYERYQPGTDSGDLMLSHDGEEGGFVIRGTIELTIGERKGVLSPGDAYYFDSRMPHRFRNPSNGVAEIVSAWTPPRHSEPS